MDKLREAIEIADKEIQELLKLRNDTDFELHHGKRTADMIVALKTFIDLAQSYLALSGKVPGDNGEWRKEFQYLLDRKILSRDELAYLFGQIKSLREQARHETLLAITGLLGEEKLEKIIETEFNRFNELVPDWCKLFEGDRELNVRDLEPNLVKAIRQSVFENRKE